MTPFRVGVTRDIRAADGRAVHDLALELLGAGSGIEWEFLARDERELTAENIDGYDALMIFEPGGVTAATLARADRLRLIARFGMGLDAIDLDACTRAGVLVTTAPDAVREVLPAGAMALLLALAHRLLEKDRAVRDGRWDERVALLGAGTLGRTMGVIGLGNVGRGVVRMAEPFGMRRLACDPYAEAETAPPGVELVDLEELLQASDFVCVTSPLTPETHHLLNAERLALMRPGSFVINVARGPIVDTAALEEALRSGHMGGAGLDVFETEPLPTDHPLVGFSNVILSPHAVAYTQSAFRGIGATASRAVLAVARGAIPDHVANPAALEAGGARPRTPPSPRAPR
jgi:phosphoglycerate dehydrogenase-like enzyme